MGIYTIDAYDLLHSKVRLNVLTVVTFMNDYDDPNAHCIQEDN